MIYLEYKEKWMNNIDSEENMLTKTVNAIINSENITHVRNYFEIKKENWILNENSANKTPSFLKCKRKKDKKEIYDNYSNNDSSTKTSNISPCYKSNN